MNIVAIVQARCDSKRFPEKVLKDLGGYPLIIYLLKRLRLSKRLNKLVLATTERVVDDPLAKILRESSLFVNAS